MRIKQISIFVENRPGRVEEILEALEKSQINIRSLSINESGEFGIVRMVVPQAEESQRKLREAGFTTRIDSLLSYSMPDIPGGLLTKVIRPLSAAGVNLKYFYVFTDPATKQSTVVLKPDDTDRAEEALKGL